jgi:hypothetical protein
LVIAGLADVGGALGKQNLGLKHEPVADDPNAFLSTQNIAQAAEKL